MHRAAGAVAACGQWCGWQRQWQPAHLFSLPVPIVAPPSTSGSSPMGGTSYSTTATSQPSAVDESAAHNEQMSKSHFSQRHRRIGSSGKIPTGTKGQMPQCAGMPEPPRLLRSAPHQLASGDLSA
eukprot:6510567-Prymnesium_polylepis.1